MLDYFFALLAPIILLPLIPFLGRLVGNFFVNRPESDPRVVLARRLDSARRLHAMGPRCYAGTCRCIESGMTLVEILVALPIIMIGLLGLMAVVPYAANNIKVGSTVTTATFLSNARIDTIKNTATAIPGGYLMTYDATGCTGIANDPITPLAGVEADVPINGYTQTGYSRTTVVTDNGSACPMKTVTVTTAYKGVALSTITLQVSPR